MGFYRSCFLLIAYFLCLIHRLAPTNLMWDVHNFTLHLKVYYEHFPVFFYPLF